MKLVIKFMSIFLFALAITACSSEDASSPEKVAEQFVSAGLKGDVDGVLKYINLPDNVPEQAKAMLKDTLKATFEESAKMVEQRGGVDKVEYAPIEYKNDEKTKAVINATMKFKDNTSETNPVLLVKVGNKWMIGM